MTGGIVAQQRCEMNYAMQSKHYGIDRCLLWILLGGLILRIALFTIAQPWTPKGEDTILHGSRDSLAYHYLAHDLVIYGRYGGNSYADPENLDPAIRPLGYALFLAFWYWLFAPRIWIPLLVQIALSTASVYLVYRIVQMMASLPAARFAAFLYAVYPNAILHANSIMTEVLYNFFALTAVYFWARFHLQQQASLRSLLMLAGLVAFFVGLGVYARVASMYLALATVILLAIVATAIEKKQRLWVGLTAIVVLLLSLLPYSLFMYSKYGTFQLTMTDAHNMLLNTVGHSIVGRKGRLDPDVREIKMQLRRELNALYQEAGIDPINSSPFERARYFRKLALKYYREQPMTILTGSLAGMARLWLWPDRIGEIADEVLPKRVPLRGVIVLAAYSVAIVHLLVLLGLVVLGIPQAYRAQRHFFWLFLLVVLYATLTSNAAGNDRYRMQAAPVLFPMAGLGYSVLARRRAVATQELS
jgi:4-amino-4-deoxy-L-arabinose transferase-like glycosyltransferase